MGLVLPLLWVYQIPVLNSRVDSSYWIVLKNIAHQSLWGWKKRMVGEAEETLEKKLHSRSARSPIYWLTHLIFYKDKITPAIDQKTDYKIGVLILREGCIKRGKVCHFTQSPAAPPLLSTFPLRVLYDRVCCVNPVEQSSWQKYQACVVMFQKCPDRKKMPSFRPTQAPCPVACRTQNSKSITRFWDNKIVFENLVKSNLNWKQIQWWWGKVAKKKM